MYKGVSQEVQWINTLDLSVLNDVLTTGKGITCFGINLLSTRPGFTCLINHLITKGQDTVMIHGHGARIIHRLYSLPYQDSFSLCQDPVSKGITAILCRADPVSALILGARKISLCVKVVNRVPEYVVHKLDDSVVVPKEISSEERCT